MEFLGKVDLKTPEVILTCFEECKEIFSGYETAVLHLSYGRTDEYIRGLTLNQGSKTNGALLQVYFGRLVS